MKPPSIFIGMKKIFTTKIFLFLILVGCSFMGCAFTEYGNRINQEQLDLSRLEEKRQTLETAYIIVLNSLETHPTEEKLIKQRESYRTKLRDINFLIDQKRNLLDQSLREWEQKIVQEKVEHEMVDKEVQENQGKNEDVEFNNK